MAFAVNIYDTLTANDLDYVGTVAPSNCHLVERVRCWLATLKCDLRDVQFQ